MASLQLINLAFALAAAATNIAASICIFKIRTLGSELAYLTALSIGLFSIGLALAIHILLVPSLPTQAQLITTVLYLAGFTTIGTGLVARQHATMWAWPAILIVAGLAGQACFFTFVAPSDLARTHTANFSSALIVTLAALSTKPTRHADYIDKLRHQVLLWTGILMFPRAITVVFLARDTAPENFLTSSIWTGIQIAQAVTLTAIALTTYATCLRDHQHNRGLAAQSARL